jgi:hypothetical protein
MGTSLKVTRFFLGLEAGTLWIDEIDDAGDTL